MSYDVHRRKVLLNGKYAQLSSVQVCDPVFFFYFIFFLDVTVLKSGLSCYEMPLVVLFTHNTTS